MHPPLNATGKIIHKLTTRFKPVKLSVIDDSASHAHHTAMKGKHAEGTHFIVEIVSSDFKNMSKIERHRAIYKELDEELKGNLHALKLTVRSDEEALVSDTGRPLGAEGVPHNL